MSLATVDFYRLKSIGNSAHRRAIKKMYPDAYTASVNLMKRCVGLPSLAIKYFDLRVNKFSYYQVLVDNSQPNLFWIKCLSQYDEGARVFTDTARRYASFEVENLLVDLGVTEKSIYCLAVWDELLQAMKVDLNNRVTNKKRIHRNLKRDV